MARELHRTIGFSIVAGWALLLLMGLLLAVSKRPAGRLSWGLLTLLQVEAHLFTARLKELPNHLLFTSQRPSTCR
jgi:VanZ family protein